MNADSNAGENWNHYQPTWQTGPDWTYRPNDKWGLPGLPAKLWQPVEIPMVPQIPQPPSPALDGTSPLPAILLAAQVEALTKQVEALIKMLGLSPQERGFLQAIVEAPDDKDLCLVLADWLEEQGRMKASKKMRKLGGG